MHHATASLPSLDPLPSPSLEAHRSSRLITFRFRSLPHRVDASSPGPLPARIIISSRPPPWEGVLGLRDVNIYKQRVRSFRLHHAPPTCMQSIQYCAGRSTTTSYILRTWHLGNSPSSPLQNNPINTRRPEVGRSASRPKSWNLLGPTWPGRPLEWLQLRSGVLRITFFLQGTWNRSFARISAGANIWNGSLEALKASLSRSRRAEVLECFLGRCPPSFQDISSCPSQRRSRLKRRKALHDGLEAPSDAPCCDPSRYLQASSSRERADARR